MVCRVQEHESVESYEYNYYLRSRIPIFPSDIFPLGSFVGDCGEATPIAATGGEVGRSVVDTVGDNVAMGKIAMDGGDGGAGTGGSTVSLPFFFLPLPGCSVGVLVGSDVADAEKLVGEAVPGDKVGYAV